MDAAGTEGFQCERENGKSAGDLLFFDAVFRLRHCSPGECPADSAVSFFPLHLFSFGIRGALSNIEFKCLSGYAMISYCAGRWNPGSYPPRNVSAWFIREEALHVRLFLVSLAVLFSWVVLNSVAEVICFM